MARKLRRNEKLDLNFLLNDPIPPSSITRSALPSTSQDLRPRLTPSNYPTSATLLPIASESPRLGTRTRGDGSSGDSNGCGKPRKSTEARVSGTSKRTKRVRVATERARCKICGHLFTQTGDLAKHILTVHEKKRPFKCEMCGKAFGEKGENLVYTSTSQAE